MKKPVRVTLKEHVERLPAGLGRHLALVPFALRLGLAYPRSVRAIAEAERGRRCETAIVEELRSLLAFAAKHVPFYRELLGRQGIQPDKVRTIEDWRRVPVVSKADLQQVPLNARCAAGARGLRINTGGTSGQPLEFLLDDEAFAREWAHMHFIWRARGYRPEHLKLTFRGKHFDSGQPIRYNAVHNEYVVNANCSMNEVVRAVGALGSASLVRWVHGYPSLVSEFAVALEQEAPRFASVLRTRLFGVLLGSEYPVPSYRLAIERILSSNIVTWYGHSEMAVLARETGQGLYESLPTYGFAEAVPSEVPGEYRLVVTSLHNRVHPFIRYDTGDLIAPESSEDGVLAFRITQGRVGDFILDKAGRRLALTAVIFGRHHASFEQIKHVQIRDEGGGVIALVVTPRSKSVDREALRRGFDLGDLAIDWRLELVDEPVRTATGKAPLKIV